MNLLALTSLLVSALRLLPVASAGNYSSYSSSSSGAYGTNYFAESQTTAYDGYAQSWRYLGWYVECGNPSDRYSQQSHHSQDDYQYYYQNPNQNWCQRFLMWAMYVDPNYSGGGVGEYSFYDYQKGQWDQSACNYHGNGKCTKMDCHDTDTENWELLGVFKEAEYFGNDAFFEQLFKHEGVCVWNDDDTYEFMSEQRENGFSEGCIATSVYNDDNSGLLYIDLKPTYNGNMTYALYTDEICSTEYDGMGVSVETVAANMGMLYGKYLQMWNDGLEVFKVCQPCMAYNLQNVPKGSSYNKTSNKYGYNKYKKYSSYGGNSYYNNRNNNYNNDDWIYGEDQYNANNDPNGGYFQCYDDANYYNVNQCMKFRTHADLESATFEDLVRATNQGGILQINVAGTVFGSPRISAEEDQYWEYIRKEEAQKEVQAAKAEKAAQELALQEAQENKAQGFLFMGAGFIALFASTLWVLFGTNGATKGPSHLSEPLYDERGSLRGSEAMENFKAESIRNFNQNYNQMRDSVSKIKTPDFNEMKTQTTEFIKNIKVPDFSGLRSTNAEVV